MNVDKMRRYAAGARENGERRDRVAWLDSLTPEHRRIHAQPVPLCQTCLGNSARAAGEQMARVMSRMGVKR